MIPLDLSTEFPRLFHQTYGRACDFVVRAPGRVNLIGEHTDYNGFPVLPMSLEQAIYAAVGIRADKVVQIRNVDSRYPEFTFVLENQVLPGDAGDWGNYVKAGIQGIIDWEKNPKPLTELHGFDCLISGTIPPGSGLSSSSALVVASALAFLEANKIVYERASLAERLAFAEHYVGTQGGGMDQAICLLGEAGHALKIDFFPLRASPVPLSEGWSIVICNSLIRAEKTKAAMRLYNRRPIECRIAAAMLEEQRFGSHGNCARLSQLIGPECRPKDLLEQAMAFFHEEGYSWAEIAAFLKEDPDEVGSRLGRMRNGSVFGETEDGFQLRKRVRHVLTEAMRVEQSFEALLSGDVLGFAELMNDSHRSCRDDYEISCPELDVLVQVARMSGAEGARLTGAGFGGCTVNLVRDENVGDFRAGIWEEYVQRYLIWKRPELGESVDSGDMLSISRPARGAEIIRQG
ncbi:MAG TPA: galactokinase [bacterium]|nr:galactokinase [bacterium]HQL61120.1 galactokinase [bacterium]